MSSQIYIPKKLSEFAGNSEVVETLHKWALKFEKGERQPPILLYGPPGIGKTTLAYVLAKEMDWEILEINASDKRNKKQVERIMGSASANAGLFSKFKLILIDEVDGLQGNSDRGGASAILNIVKNARQPVILTANDGWSKKISSLRAYCKFLEMKRISKSTIRDVLEHIALELGIKISSENIVEIARNSNGDLRSAIIDLTSYVPGSYRDRDKIIFDSIREMFKAKTFTDAIHSFDNSTLDYDTIKLWIEQNIKNEYEEKSEISCAYNYLSLSDRFYGRIIKRQAWKLLKYSYTLITGGVSSCKNNIHFKFTKYEYPSYFRSMSMTHKQRSMRKNILSKIAKRCHCSIKEAKNYIIMLKQAIKKGKNVGEFMEFNDEEIKFLSKMKGF